jgi:nucleotide-binding universal stress UspA family protein
MSARKSLSILLADDGSEHSQAAVSLIGDLPLSDSSEIMALRVFTPADTDKVWLLEESLEQTRKALEAQGMKVKTNLVLGYPAEKIAEVAKERHADLIVMGAKGLRATFGILLGGVVQQVVEYADHPVLVVRAPYRELKQILLLVDGSEQSRKAVEYVCDFPWAEDVHILALHVMPPRVSAEDLIRYLPVGAEPPVYVPTEETVMRLEQQSLEEERKGKSVLQETEEKLRSAKIPSATLLLRGDAATEIIQYANEHPVDLIVTGGRGLSQSRIWKLGSVTRKLVHYAPCSVMVVK